MILPRWGKPDWPRTGAPKPTTSHPKPPSSQPQANYKPIASHPHAPLMRPPSFPQASLKLPPSHHQATFEPVIPLAFGGCWCSTRLAPKGPALTIRCRDVAVRPDSRAIGRSGHWVTTRKNVALAGPGVTVKLNVPVPAVLVCSGVHWFSGVPASGELTSAKGRLTGPVPLMVSGLP